MAEAYSYDLRQKVLSAIDNGMKKSEASRVFARSCNTIDLWLERREATGDCQAKQGYQTGSGHHTDWEKFRAFAKEHGDKTQTEMAQLWGNSISQRTTSRALKRIGLTRKTRRTATVNATKTSGKLSSSN